MVVYTPPSEPAPADGDIRLYFRPARPPPAPPVPLHSHEISPAPSPSAPSRAPGLPGGRSSNNSWYRSCPRERKEERKWRHDSENEGEEPPDGVYDSKSDPESEGDTSVAESAVGRRSEAESEGKREDVGGGRSGRSGGRGTGEQGEWGGCQAGSDREGSEGSQERTGGVRVRSGDNRRKRVRWRENVDGGVNRGRSVGEEPDAVGGGSDAEAGGEEGKGAGSGDYRRSLDHRPSVVTYNARSLSLGSTLGDRDHWLQSRKRTGIGRLLSRFDHVLLQETWAGSKEIIEDRVRSSCPGAHIAASCFQPSRLGVAIITRASVLLTHSPTVYESESHHGLGRIVSVLWEPRDASTHSSYRTTCVHISSSGRARTAQATEVKDHIPPSPFHILGGDTNFTYRPEDAYTFRPYNPPPLSWRECWADCLDWHGLEEVYQPTHTRYQQDPVTGLAKSTRLDRVFVARPLTHTGLYEATSWVVPSIPGSITDLTRTGRVRWVERLDSMQGVSDHVPVGLRFAPRHTKGGGPRRKSVPGWVLEHPSFLPTFSHLWRERAEEEAIEDTEGFALLARAKSVAYEAASQVAYAADRSRERSLTDVVRIGLDTLRVIATPHTSNLEVWRATQGHEAIVSLVDFHLPGQDRVGRLRAWLERALRAVSDPGVGPEATELPPPHPVRPSAVQSLAKALPRLRARVSALQDARGSLTSDPAAMTAIAQGFWGKKWRRRQLARSPSSLFRAWGKRASKPPAQIHLAEMEAAIMGAGKTAAGPDGIPFLFWKVTREIVGPVLLACLRQLQAGVNPPPDFNAGTLHLVPKKGTPLIQDTRPIVVNNTDNRIIASAVKTSLTEVLGPLIDPAQTGSLPGRSMEDNILFFNEKFYGAMEGGEDYDLILFDFAKAFDSVSHDAIFCLLEQVGLPPEWIRAVRGLFHGAHCFTNLGGKAARIPFLQGIKQGCPLSPLLFVLVMDVLHDLISKPNPAVDARIYVDDTAAGAKDICPALANLAAAFKLFKMCTGLALNFSKSVVLSTRAEGSAGRARIRRCLRAVGWEDFSVADSAPYLGLPFGNGVEVGDAFMPAIEKFENKAAGYQRVIQSLSITRRVTALNVFLLPLLEYPSRFFVLRKNHLKSYAANVRALLMRGNDVEWEQHSRPTALCGHAQPLRDIQLANIAALACRIGGDPIEDPEEFDPWQHVNSMRVSVHVQIAVAYAMQIGLSEAQVRSSRREIFTLLCSRADGVMSDFRRDYSGYLHERLRRRGCPVATHEHIIANYARLPAWVPAYARSNFLDLIHNSHATAARMASFGRGGRSAPHTDVREDCYVCGHSDGDSATHLFLECPAAARAVRAARARFGLVCQDRVRLGFNEVRAHLPPARITGVIMAYLDARPAGDTRGFVWGWRPCPPLEAGIQIMITWALWRLRQEARLGYEMSRATAFVVSDVTSRLLRICPQVLTEGSLPGSSLPALVKAAAANASGSTGSAGKRTPAQKASARAQAERIVRSLPADAIQIWSDGAASPNPGPAGAGAVVVVPRGDERVRMEVSLALGHASNNVGEIVAIGAGALALRSRLRAERGLARGGAPREQLPQVHIFTDSMVTKAIAEEGGTAFAREHARLISSLWALFRSMRNAVCGSFVFHHVGGHCGIPLNEAADSLASKGAARSAAMGAHAMPMEEIARIVGRDGEGFLSFPTCG